MQIWAANYQNHMIVVTNNTSGEKLLIDDKPVAENNGGLKLSSTLTGEIPLSDKSVFSHVSGDGTVVTCRTYAGYVIPVETNKKEYSAMYEGHELKVVTKGKCTLFIDGQKVDCSDSSMGILSVLGGLIPGTDKRVVAFCDNTGMKMCVNFIADAERIPMCRYKKEGGELIPLENISLQENGTMLMTAAMILMLAT